mgnify:CR=1 FL=1
MPRLDWILSRSIFNEAGIMVCLRIPLCVGHVVYGRYTIFVSWTPCFVEEWRRSLHKSMSKWHTAWCALSLSLLKWWLLMKKIEYFLQCVYYSIEVFRFYSRHRSMLVNDGCVCRCWLVYNWPCPLLLISWSNWCIIIRFAFVYHCKTGTWTILIFLWAASMSCHCRKAFWDRPFLVSSPNNFVD